MRTDIFVTFLAVALTSCASQLTPRQERAWDAFYGCQKRIGAWGVKLRGVSPEGQMSIVTDPDLKARDDMVQCLEEYGYRFHKG